MDKAYVAICLPASWTTIPTTAGLKWAEFLAGVTSTCVHKSSEYLDNYIMLDPDRSNPVDRSRSRMVKQALAHRSEEGRKATHLLLIDIDQIYPHGMLDKLLACDKDIIGPLAFFKSGAHKPIAQNTNDTGGATPIDIFDDEWNLLDTPVPADIVGLGGLLVKREVFETLDGPWFRYDASKRGVTEGLSHDISFCDDAIASGFQPYVLPSCVSPHIAEIAVTEHHWQILKRYEQAKGTETIETEEVTNDYMGYGSDFYDMHAKHFSNDELFADINKTVMRICDRAELDSPTVLDFGSGNGKFSELSAWDVTNHDISKHAQEEYGALGSEALQNVYDLIFCSEVMEHFETEEDAAKAIEGWLQTQPKMAICTINMSQGKEQFPTHHLMRKRGWWVDFFEAHGWSYDVGLSEMANWAEGHNLEYFVFRPNAVTWEQRVASTAVTYQDETYSTSTLMGLHNG